MAVVLGLKKATQVIRLDDSEGSPEYVLDLTDEAIQSKAVVLRDRFLIQSEAVSAIQGGNGALGEKDREVLIKLWKDIVETTLGDNAWLEILEYARDGQDVKDTDMVMVLAPVVFYLMEQLTEVITLNSNKAYAKYLQDKAFESAI